MIIFEGSSIEYEVELIDQEKHIIRVKDNKSKMIFEGVALSFETNRCCPSYTGPIVAMKPVYDIKVEMIKVLRVKQ